MILNQRGGALTSESDGGPGWLRYASGTMQRFRVCPFVCPSVRSIGHISDLPEEHCICTLFSNIRLSKKIIIVGVMMH